MPFADHPMWRSMLPQSNGMPMMQPPPAAQVCEIPAVLMAFLCVGELEAIADWQEGLSSRLQNEHPCSTLQCPGLSDALLSTVLGSE